MKADIRHPRARHKVTRIPLVKELREAAGMGRQSEVSKTIVVEVVGKDVEDGRVERQSLDVDLWDARVRRALIAAGKTKSDRERC